MSRSTGGPNKVVGEFTILIVERLTVLHVLEGLGMFGISLGIL